MDIKDAQQEILAAADWWARDAMRLDRQLSPVEQTLFDAVIYYQKLERCSFELPLKFPKPPNIPKDFQYVSRESQIPTKRYSDIPTKLSPPFGIPGIDIDELDIEDL